MKTFVLLALVLSSIIGLSLTMVEAKTVKMDNFSVEIPKGCKLDQEKNRFQTDTTSLDCNNDREMVFESGTFDELLDMNQTPEEMVSELEMFVQLLYSESSPEIFESGADKYTINNSSAPYALATWTHTGYNLFGAELEKDVAGMMIAIKLGGNNMVLGQYIAPQEDFDKFLNKAEDAFESVKPITNGETETETKKMDFGDRMKAKGITVDQEVIDKCNNPSSESERVVCSMMASAPGKK